MICWLIFKLLIIQTCLFAVMVSACQDPNCINCVTDPAYCKTCKPGFRATLGKCDPGDDPLCSNCN